MRGDVRRLAIKGSGQLERPKSWSGSVVGTIDNLAAGGVVFDTAAIDISAADGVATIRAVELKQGPSNISLRGTAELPETLDGFGRSPASIELRGVAPDLGAITAGMAQPIAGSAEVNGRVNIRDARINADLSIAAGPIDFGKGTVQKAIVNIRATKQMPPEEQERPYFEGLTSEIGLDVTDVRASGFAIDAVAGEVRTNGQNVTIEQLIVNRRDNRITMRGQYLLPMDFALAASQPGAVELSLVAANVGDYWESEDAPARVTGALQLWVQTDLRGGVGDGSFSVYGANLRARNMVIPELSASGSTAGNVVYLNDLTASLNARDYIRANGTAGINAPHDYSGSLALNIADLGTFESLLETAGKKTDLAGALAINWQGSGSVSNFKNTGSLKLTLDDGRYANLDNLEANVDANYTPDELNVPIIFVSSDKLMFQAIMQAKGETLEVTKLEVVQGQAKYGSGYVSVPFIWANVGSDRPLFPTGGKVLVNFQTENLDINKLGKDFGTEIPVKGLANVKLDADGTIDDLRATLALQLTGLQSEKLEDFTPATFGMNARIENKQLVIDGKLEQARISPIAITANLPLDVAKIVQNKKIDEGTPVRAKVQMPRSSVNFVRQFVPALQRIDGNAALDVNIGGTIADPTFSGAADMTINAARFSNATLPALTNFNARLVFDGNALTFPQFRGELAGGPFTVSGRITFPKLTEPTFDLQLRADAVLVARNDDMTVRVDANVSVVGPLAGATVAGNIGITNSQFLKNLDLIPIGMPGRPPPAPKPPAASPTLSFPEPPLRDWKFDLVIKTKDPFMIRGNLANGGALVDMRISGTGLEPKIDGSVRLQNVEATLPFSRLEISQGFLYFNPNDPMNPGLDLQGTSIIRDYTIRVYVYGTADSPEAVFTSEPPLPQEEIISLLATGTTREELLGGGNVLAGRALMLLGQQLYQKVFKKGQAASTNSVFDRLQVDVGNVDPRTGQQTATARYRVTDKVLVIGDIGVQGDFRGTVKYLIRFR
jgi:autotransporter translocation and assembly factor TamB